MSEVWGYQMLPNEKCINIDFNKKLNFTTIEYEYLCKYCGFTDVELKVFEMRQRGMNNIRISLMLRLSQSTINRHISKIKKKIKKTILQNNESTLF